MTTTIGRTCLTLGLLGLALAAALSVDLNARRDGVTVQAQVASMQLQGSADVDENSATPDDEGEKNARCAQRSGCSIPKPELAFMRSEDRPLHESKAFVAQGDEIRPKSKD